MKKAMWIISCISVVGTAFILPFMPESVPMHYDTAGNVDRWGSKYENFVFPILIIAMSLFWTLLIFAFEKKAGKTSDEKERASALSNAKFLGAVGMAMAGMFTIMQGFILYGSYEEAISAATHSVVDIGQISCILLGVLYIVLGNIMPKTRNNGVAGVRISWSMYNDNTWRRSNRFGGYAMVTVGILTIITAAFMSNSFMAAMIMLGYLCAATIITVVYAHKVYIQELESEGKR
jgi:uncharacterized membrane protein